jgi:hypothetical protein
MFPFVEKTLHHYKSHDSEPLGYLRGDFDSSAWRKIPALIFFQIRGGKNDNLTYQ